MGIAALISGLTTVLLPEAVVKKIYSNRETYRGQTIDAKALAVGKFALALRNGDDDMNIAASRAQTDKITRLFETRGPVLARLEDFQVSGAEGQVEARLYSTTTDKTTLKPALAFFHGGGFVQGNLQSHNALCTKLAGWSDGIVIAIDYRLAPEHPYPQGVDDCLAAYLSIVENAASLGVDAQRIGVGGDSAGGCFAAVVTQQAIERKKPVPAFQLLIYPVTEGYLDSPSINDLAQAYVLPKNRMVWYRDLYAGDFKDFNDPKFSPLLATDFSGQPATWLLTAGFDPLCDDGLAYVEKLERAGVDVTHRHYPGQVHGFVNLTKVIPQGDQAIKEMTDWLKSHW
jgi:acetyl esterase